MIQKINFYNHKDAEIAALAIVHDIKNDTIKKWYQTIATRWLRKQEECSTPVLPGTENLPEWAQKDLENGKSIHHFVISQGAKNKLLNIAHWLEILNNAVKKKKNKDLIEEAQKVFGNLPKTSVEAAHKKANEWYEKEAKKSSKSLLKKSQSANALEIIESQDGYIWERISTNAIIAVGQELFNSLRYGIHNHDVKNNIKNIWALRDPKGYHVAALTIIVKNKTIIECKGYNNEPAYGCGKHVFNLMEKLNLKNHSLQDLRQINIISNVYLPEAKPSETLSNGQDVVWIEKNKNYSILDDISHNKTTSKDINIISQLTFINKKENNQFVTQELINIDFYKNNIIITNNIHLNLKEEDYKKIFNLIVEKIEEKKNKGKTLISINDMDISNIKFFQVNSKKDELVYWDQYLKDIKINKQNLKHLQVKLSDFIKRKPEIDKIFKNFKYNNQIVDQYYTYDKENNMNLAVIIVDNNKGYIQNDLDKIIEGNPIDFLKEIDPKGDIFLPKNTLESYNILNKIKEKNSIYDFEFKDFMELPKKSIEGNKWPWCTYPTGKGWSHIDQLTEVIDLEGFENYKIKIQKLKTKDDFDYLYQIIDPNGKIITNVFHFKKTIYFQGSFNGNTEIATAFMNYIKEKNFNDSENAPLFISYKNTEYEIIKRTKTSITTKNGFIIKANKHWFGTEDGINMLWQINSPKKKVVSNVKILTFDKKNAIKNLAEVSKEIGLTFLSNQEEFKETGYTIANGNLITRAMPHIEDIYGFTIDIQKDNTIEKTPMKWERITLTENDLEWQISPEKYDNNSHIFYYPNNSYVYVDTKGIAYFNFCNKFKISTEEQINAINVFLQKTNLKPDIFTLLRLNCIFKNGQMEKPDKTSILKEFKENQFSIGEDIWHIDNENIQLLDKNNEVLISFNYSMNEIKEANLNKTGFKTFIKKSNELNDFLDKLKNTL